MRRYAFIQLDVFTETPFQGNQLAVFPQAEGLSDAEMQAIANEMNYSESTFVLPPADPAALARVRIFTPATELPFAGHPVIGTVFALAHVGRVQPERDGSPVIFELGVGPLSIDLLYEGADDLASDDRLDVGQTLSFAWMRQPLPTFSAWEGDRTQLADALGLAADDPADDLPIERGSAGVPFVYIPLRSRAALARVRPGADLYRALGLSAPTDQTGAFLFTLADDNASEANAPVAESTFTVYGRMFAPFLGLREDPATGSAAGPLGAYLVRHGRAQPDTQTD